MNPQILGGSIFKDDIIKYSLALNGIEHIEFLKKKKKNGFTVLWLIWLQETETHSGYFQYKRIYYTAAPHQI